MRVKVCFLEEGVLMMFPTLAACLPAANGRVFYSVQPGREKDTEEAARAYLDQYRIYDVLEELFTSVLFSKPAEPLAFLVGESKRLKSIAGIAKGAVSLSCWSLCFTV